MTWLNSVSNFIQTERQQIHSHAHLRARFAIVAVMLILAFLGVVITDFAQSSAWRYWCITAIIFALMSISLSIVTAKRTNAVPFSLLLREALHWIALMAAIYLVSLYLHFGTLSHVLAGLFVLTLLSLTTLLAGIHFDPMYVPVGIILGLFAVVMVVFVQYFMAIALGILLIAGALLALFYWKKYR